MDRSRRYLQVALAAFELEWVPAWVLQWVLEWEPG